MGRDALRRQGHAEGERRSATTSLRSGKGKPIHKRRDVSSWSKYPEDKTEKDLEKHVAPAIRGHMQDFLEAIATRGKPVADIEQGHISTASCILANLSMKLGRTLTWDAEQAAGRRRRRGQQAAAPAVPQAVGASGGVIGPIVKLACESRNGVTDTAPRQSRGHCSLSPIK